MVSKKPTKITFHNLLRIFIIILLQLAYIKLTIMLISIIFLILTKYIEILQIHKIF